MSAEEQNERTIDMPEKSGLSLTELMHAQLDIPSPFMKEIFLTRQSIVGTRYLGGSDELVEDLVPGSRVTFVAEPDNRFDKHAVMALDEQGRKLGYIPRNENRIIGSLLKAGKSIYGIMPDQQPSQTGLAPGSERTPYSLWVDLYMREFLLPDDMAQIPRQGYQGSYAVADFIPWNDEEQQISSIFAIKVINGKERDTFRKTIGRENPEEYREAIADFRKFVGYLPIVSHDITEEILPQLEEAYGVQLGMPFSNQVIDTLQMAVNHLPWVRDKSLDNLAEELGIQVNCDTREETRCRLTWKLYCRMEKSELEKAPKSPPEPDQSEHTVSQINRLDIPIEEYPMSERTRVILRANQIMTLRELSRCSRKETAHFKWMDDEHLEECKKMLTVSGGSFRHAAIDQTLYGYPDEIRKIAHRKDSAWEYQLFFGAIITYFEWLQHVRNLPLYLWKTPVIYTTISDNQEFAGFLEEKTEALTALLNGISDTINDQLQRAVGAPGEPGDVKAIMLTVQDLMNIYKKIMMWKQSFQHVWSEHRYRNAIEKCAGLAEGLLASFDDIHDQSADAYGKLEAYRKGELEENKLNIQINFNVDENLHELKEALKEFM